ncbi:MAG: hypothetical protein ACOC4B_01080 [Bacteroidota bacterium]
MKRRDLLILLIAFVLGMISCEENEEEQEFGQMMDKNAALSSVINLPGAQEPTGFIQMKDGFLITGEEGNSKGFLIKVNNNLQIEWQNSYDEQIYSITESNGKYIISGQNSDKKPWIGKINKYGEIIWNTVPQISDLKEGKINKILPTSNGFVVIGWKNKGESDIYTEAFIAKINGTGEIDTGNTNTWELIVNNNTNYSEGLDIIEEFGYFYISGTSTDVITKENAWILKVDQNGNVIKTRHFDNDAMTCKLNCLKKASDCIVGTGAWGKNKLWIVKFSPGLEQIKMDKKYRSTTGYLAEGNDILIQPDDQITIVGYDFGNMPNGWILNLSGDKLEWTTNIGPYEQLLVLKSVYSFNKNQYIVSGTVNSKSEDESDIILIKTDEHGRHTGCF